MSEESKISYRSVVDLSHELGESTPPFPGDPAISEQSLADIHSTGYSLSAWTTVFHTGTHLDAPSHFIPGGAEMTDFPIDGIFSACLADVQGIGIINPEHLPNEMPPGTDILIFRTGWASRFGSSAYFNDHPVISEDTARSIIQQGYRIVGFDLPSPDKEPFPIHHILLDQGIYLLENLNRLHQIPENQVFSLICIPLPIRAEASWVRPLALLP